MARHSSTTQRTFTGWISYSTISWIIVLLIAVVCALQLFLLNSPQFSTAGTLPVSNSNTPLQPLVKPKWAYVFLLADCDPTQAQPTYRGMLYNILAATYALKYCSAYDTMGERDRTPSRADIVVLVQMTVSTNAKGLAPAEEALMEQMGIQVRYLPRPDHEPSFYELVMAKFHVLTMIEYYKIIFLDGDVLPLCNLDYLFELSSIEDKHAPNALGDTVLHAMYDDPVNAGLFLVTPGGGSVVSKDWNETMLHWNALLATPLSQRPRVDYRLWKGESQSGWDFYCGDSDQGFLLYWSLFLQSQSVSIVVGQTLENYDEAPRTSANPITRVQRQPSRKRSTRFLADYSCLENTNNTRSFGGAQNANWEAAQWPFYRDFYHMVGYSKAWESRPKSPRWNQVAKHQLESSRDYWYWVLQRVVDRWDSNHTAIPHPLDGLSQVVGKPKLRGDLIFTIPKAP